MTYVTNAKGDIVTANTDKNQSIYNVVLKLAVPMMIQSGITNAVGLVDNLMVGSLGTERMTAVSIAGQLFFVFYLAVFGGLSGPGIYGAQFYGKKNEEGVRNIVRLKCWIVMLIVFAGILTFIFFGNDLLLLYFQGDAAEIDATLTLELAHEYLMIMLIGLVPFGVTQIYSGSLRMTNESIKPMVAGIVSVVADIVFNYLLIYGKLGLPELGVRGAAIATVISRFVECGVIVIWSHKDAKKHTFLLGLYKKLTVPVSLAREVIIKGFPIFLNEFMWAGGMAFMTQSYSVRGLEIIAGSNISNSLCNLMNVVFIAMGNAVGIITGQMLGASEYERAKTDSKKLMRFTALLCAGLTLILVATAKLFPLLYNTTEDVRRIGTLFIILTALFFPVQGYLNALYFTLRSGGKTVITFLFDSIFTWVIPVPIAFVLCMYTSINIYIVFVIVQACDIVKLLYGRVLIGKGIWINNLIDK